MTEIAIKPIAEEHIESFHRALDTVARERRYLTFLQAPPLEDTREFVLDMIASHSQFVALSNNEVIGWCDIRRNTHAIQSHGGLLGMGILPAYRGKGLGERLIRTTIDHARAKGLLRVQLSVHVDNERAIRLYQRAGFIREGIRRDSVCIDGRFIDVIDMALLFR